MDTGLQIREHGRWPGLPLTSRRPAFCLALGVLFRNSNGNAPIPMRMLWWVKDTPRPRESCPRSPLSQNIKAEHERDPTYLVSSMLSDEASPELGLELAAGTRSGTQEPHGGQRAASLAPAAGTPSPAPGPYWDTRTQQFSSTQAVPPTSVLVS